MEVLDRCVRDALGLEDGEDPGEASETIDAGDVRDIVHEASVHDAVAMGTTPLLIEAGEAADDPQLQAMAGELAAWAEADYPWRSADGEHYDDAGHAIWDETRLALQRLVFEPYLGEHTPEVQLDPPKEADIQEWEDPHAGDHGRVIRDTALVRILDGDASFDWLDGQSPTAVAQTALEEAARTLEREFGTDDPQEWNKPIHVTEFMAIGAGEEDAMPMLNRGSFNQIVALGPEMSPPRVPSVSSRRATPDTCQ
ncbi:MAG: hypothetical protein U5K37_10910 [Natrialbaceae archaeon]|nr:hypothetical protein [Natrialbaceae archaeon]